MLTRSAVIERLSSKGSLSDSIDSIGTLIGTEGCASAGFECPSFKGSLSGSTGRDSIGRGSAGRDSAGRDSTGRDSIGRGSIGEGLIGTTSGDADPSRFKGPSQS